MFFHYQVQGVLTKIGMYMQEQPQSFIYRHKVLIFVIAIIAVTVFILSGYGFLTVEIERGGAGDYTYIITDQKGNEIADVKSSSAKLRRFVKRGTYEVTATHGSKNSFSVVSTPGFLRQSNTRMTLAEEKRREFVGNNPEFCMFYNSGVLYSYACLGATSKSKHVPATSTMPTYISKNDRGVPGVIEDVAQTNQGTIALFRFNGLADIAPHTAFLWKENVNTGGGVALTDLDPSRAYLIAPAGEGFFVYDSSYSQAFYYSSLKSEPQKIEIELPSEDMEPVSIHARGKSLLVSLSNNEHEDIEPQDRHDDDSYSEFLLYENGSSKKLSLERPVSDARICGQTKLCVLAGDSMEVYSINKDKLSYIFSVSNVQAIIKSQNQLVVARSSGIFNINPDTQSGFIEYPLGEYNFCGSEDDGEGYLLCLTSPQNKKVVLRIDQDTNNQDNIDKKITELEKLPEISSVSITHSFIYISPNLGELRFNRASGDLEYDPAVVKSAQKKINDKITELGIDKTRYKIKITGIN